MVVVLVTTPFTLYREREGTQAAPRVRVWVAGPLGIVVRELKSKERSIGDRSIGDRRMAYQKLMNLRSRPARMALNTSELLLMELVLLLR